MREVIATGRTVEEATEAGCSELGLSRDEVSVEILEMPQKKLFKSTPAKVKVTADGGEETPAAPAPKAEAKPAPAKAAAPAPKPEAAPAPKAEHKPEGKKEPILPAEPEEVIDLEASPRVKMAAEYLQTIFDAMGAGDVKMTAYRQGDATLFRVEEGSVADKMEIRGEVIQALSYLIDRSVNTGVDKKDDDYLRIRLDIAGYRSRRETELIALAGRTAKEVARTGRSRTLAPMNPYERLIVHTAISSMEGVMSESIGADTERRVVVKSTGPDATDGDDWRPPRKGGGGGGRDRDRNRGRNDRGGDRGGRGGRDNRDNRGGGRGGDRDRKPPYGEKRSSTPEREYADTPRDPNAAPVVPQRREAVHDGDDLPLYGKIDL